MGGDRSFDVRPVMRLAVAQVPGNHTHPTVVVTDGPDPIPRIPELEIAERRIGARDNAIEMVEMLLCPLFDRPEALRRPIITLLGGDQSPGQTVDCPCHEAEPTRKKRVDETGGVRQKEIVVARSAL